MQAQQKRLLRLGVCFDSLHRPIAEHVRHVAVTLDQNLLLVELVSETRIQRMVVRPGSVCTMIEIVATAAEYSEEVVVAALQGTESVR
jgi:hypothetical protein